MAESGALLKNEITLKCWELSSKHMQISTCGSVTLAKMAENSLKLTVAIQNSGRM